MGNAQGSVPGEAETVSLRDSVESAPNSRGSVPPAQVEMVDAMVSCRTEMRL